MKHGRCRHRERWPSSTLRTFLTLDGVMQGPGGPEEDPTGGFTSGGWTVPYADADMGAIVDGWMGETDAILFGRTTYGLMAPFWSAVTDPENLVARPLNLGRRYVVSTTLTHAGWGQTTILRSLGEVRELRARDGGELQVHGSAALASALDAAGLVDAYRLFTFPVSVGAGQRLFGPDAAPSGYELVSSRTTGAGATYVELRPTAFVGGGAFRVEDGRETH